MMKNTFFACIFIGLFSMMVTGCGGREAPKDVLTNTVNTQETDSISDTVEDEESILENGEWKGLQWEVTSEGCLNVTGHAESGIKYGSNVPWRNYAYKIESAYLDFTGADSLKMFFKDYGRLASVDLSNLDTSNVTNMSDMFSGCSSLTELDLSSIDTSNVTDMSSMFSGCSSLTELNLSSFNTGNVRLMNQMFYNCGNLTELDLSSFDTSNVSNMSEMFTNCISLEELHISNFDTANVTDTSHMFSGCKPSILK